MTRKLDLLSEIQLSASYRQCYSFSVRSIDISCSRCSFSSSAGVLWGKREYVLPDQSRIPIDAALAWCAPCNGLVAAEVVDLSAKSQERRSLQSLRGRLLNELAGTGGLLRTLTGFGSSKVERTRKDLQHCEELIQQTGIYLNAMGQRQSPPRCLECCGVEITPVILPEVSDARGAMPIGFIHPRCGGQLVAAVSPVSWSMNFTNIRLYNLEGMLVSVIDTAAPQAFSTASSQWSKRSFTIKASG